MRSDVSLATVVILLGGFGTWLLLPHRLGRLKPRRVQGLGAVLAMLAVVLLARFYTPPGALLQSAFFYMFATASVAGGILTVTSRNPVSSALWFASVVLATSGLFLLAGAQFLAAGTVIVYAGAIIVTFLFVIMLAQSEGMALYDRMSRAPGGATLSGFLLLWAVYFALITIQPATRPAPDVPYRPLPAASSLIALASTDTQPGPAAILPAEALALMRRAIRPTARIRDEDPARVALGSPPPHVAGLGGTLFADHLLSIELAGALLFVALTGAISIATPRPPIRPANPDASGMGDVAQAQNMQSRPT